MISQSIILLSVDTPDRSLLSILWETIILFGIDVRQDSNVFGFKCFVFAFDDPYVEGFGVEIVSEDEGTGMATEGQGSIELLLAPLLTASLDLPSSGRIGIHIS